MTRGVLLPAAVVFSFALGCGGSAQEQAAKPADGPAPAPPAPTAAAPATAPGTPEKEPYRKVSGPIALVRIGVDGTARPETLEIDDFKKNETIIVWVADCPAETLTVRFKDVCDGEPRPPHLMDPSCASVACAIDAKRVGQVVKKATVCYSLVITVPGRDAVTIDPKLIINP
ncbi:MAG: hypothetical protein IPP07_21860 [Holophagales bacterium]|nr:hypothetical protein [Holophagales bacterium]MBK9967375.1 hypothetical protein [Holophagales bacterium]